MPPLLIGGIGPRLREGDVVVFQRSAMWWFFGVQRCGGFSAFSDVVVFQRSAM
jgi:hypothetical protein